MAAIDSTAPAAPARVPPEDPYRRWAEATRWSRLRPGGRWPLYLSFVVERVGASADWKDLRAFVSDSDVNALIAHAFDEALAAGAEVSHFATLRLITRDNEPRESIEQRIERIAAHPQVARLQLGYPRGAAQDQYDATSAEAAAPGEPQDAEVVLGIIDDGCPFGHPGLLDRAGGQPRMAVLWQQSTRNPATAPWTKAGGFGYGRVLDRAAMAGLMARSKRFGEIDEGLLYQLAYTQVDLAGSPEAVVPSWPKPSRALLSRACHGASVIGLLAAEARPAYALPDEESASHRPYARAAGNAEAAAQCPLIGVDLPREQVEISSGRWMPVSALDGLRFIVTEARRRFRRPGGGPVPVVINLSFGASAGAHVGEAMFERAMDEWLSRDDQLAIALAAGNSRDVDAHAELQVPAGGSVSVGLSVPASHPFDTCVELWLPAGAEPSKITVTATSPSGRRLEAGGAAGIARATLPATPAPGAECSAALFFFPQVVQATGRTMVMLAVAGSTVTSKRRNPTRAGPWMIEVHNAAGSPIVVQAWIERDETAFGPRRDQIARFFSLRRPRLSAADEGAPAGPVSLTNTLSNIATGGLAFAVGAFAGRASGAQVNGRELAAGAICDYSGQPAAAAASAGPSYLPFAAVADAGRSHPGIRVHGNRGDTLRRMNGTSAASPQAARFIANEMAAGRSRADIVAALPAQPPTPQHPNPGNPSKPGSPGPAPAPDPADGRMRL